LCFFEPAWLFYLKFNLFMRIHFLKSTWFLYVLWKYQGMFKVLQWNARVWKTPTLKTQWPKEKLQKDKQRSTKHTYKTKDRVTRTALKPGGALRCSGTNTNNVNKTWALLGVKTNITSFLTGNRNGHHNTRELWCLPRIGIWFWKRQI
jgi:hypothetical protein